MLARLLAVVLLSATIAIAAEAAPPAGKTEDQTMPPENAPADEPAAALPTELVIEAPAGWLRQDDAKNHIVYLTPPDARSIREAGLAVFPASDYAGTAEQYHSQMLATALRGSSLLEPVQSGTMGGFLVSAAHYTTPRGGNLRFVLYTARWGMRAQAIMFATARDDFYNRDGPVSQAAVAKARIPSASGVSPATATEVSSAVPAAPAAVASDTGGTGTGDSIPVLNYNGPTNFYRGGSKYPYEYTCNDVNFAICVYPFRPFTGDIAAVFQQTLLRDWIDVRYREEALAGPPQFDQNRVPGADAVYEARFQEQLVGPASLRMRVLIVAGNMAAMVDAKAPTAFAWQKEAPALQALLMSLRVDRKAAPPSVTGGPGPEGAALAGLYAGTKLKYMVNLNRMAGFGDTVPARHFYLFSADGRVFRCYDNPPAGGDWRRFDFDAARRDDPTNSGRFTVRDHQLYIELGSPPGQPPNVITTAINDPNLLEIESVKYVRSP
ncbi:MAG TPA: hypothetical protein VMI53_11535 [Opitutaceae bacterium]|nr:hypothetical protein [Opitutaceae bacterium]